MHGGVTYKSAAAAPWTDRVKRWSHGCCDAPVTVRKGTRDCGVFQQVFSHHFYKYIYPIAHTFSPKYILDAGGNVGFSTVMFKLLWPEAIVVGLEPDPANFATYQLNTAPFRGVHAVNAGLWGHRTRLAPAQENMQSWGKVFKEVGLDEEGIDAYSVKDIAAMFNIPGFDFVKMDVEGAEGLVFMGDKDLSWLHDVQLMALEVHEGGNSPFGLQEVTPQIFEALSSTGMRGVEDGEHVFFMTQQLQQGQAHLAAIQLHATAAQLHATAAQLHEGLRALAPGLLQPPKPDQGRTETAAPPPEVVEENPWQRQAATAALAFAASVCMHLGGGGAALALNLPSVAEDKLLEVVRLLESTLDTAVQYAGEALSSAVPGAPSLGASQQEDASLSSSASSQQQQEGQWRALVEDVWEVVDANFMDARGAGFTRERWRELRDEVLARPLQSRAAAYGAIRDMLRALRDPYSRFISPDEFSAMLKYDVSGVGLNLGTAEEFVNKTGIALPGYDPPPMVPLVSQPGPDSLASSSGASESSQGSGDAAFASTAAALTGSTDSPGSELPELSGTAPPPPSLTVASSSSSSAGSRASQPGGVYVLGLIKGSAADAAGIQQGDQLLTIAGQGVAGQSPFEVASLLSGGQDGEDDEGAMDALGLRRKPVQLQVKKYGTEQVLSVSLERPVRVIPSPVSARLEQQQQGPLSLPSFLQPPSLPFSADSRATSTTATAMASSSSSSSSGNGELVGYIKLTSFNARAQRDLAAAVRQLEGAGASRLVLDLRDNRGGLVSEGIEVARLFLQEDALVVRTAGKARASAAPITASGPALTSVPLVVLVNEHTASASEILAGALQDNCRAVLAGRQTYGKGLIQSVYELGDGSGEPHGAGLVLTVGKYVTPRGTDIDREGIRPQFRALPSPAAAEGALGACRLMPLSQQLLQPR
ncbi:hypothetical protein N2152v2_006309 [Parachlorella kessleri]